MIDDRARFIELYNYQLELLGAKPVSEVLVMQRLGRFMQLRGRTWRDAERRVLARSPLDTLQEQQVGMPYEEWRILVCCILLNQTHGRQVRPMLQQLWAVARSPQQMVEAVTGKHYELLTQLLRPLGFVNRRLKLLLDMSTTYLEQFDGRVSEFVNGDWALALPGCGQYAVDALNVFRYRIMSNVSSDTWINDYIDWCKNHGNIPARQRQNPA